MIIEDIYRALRNADIKVYLTSQMEGEINGECVCVADAGAVAQGKTIGRRIYYITAFVPFERPLDIYPLLDRVRAALSEVRDIKPTGETSEGQINDELKAYYMTAEYYAMCTL